MLDVYSPALEVTRAEGCRVFDRSARSYLDFTSGAGVCSLGHAHPVVAEALAVTPERPLHISNLFAHQGAEQLAEAYCAQLGEGKIFFANSGAEANELLLKLARRWGERCGQRTIIVAERGFHGRTLGALAATHSPVARAGFGPFLPEIRHIRFNDIPAMEEAFHQHGVGAVLLEGVQGEAGVYPASTDFLHAARSLTRRAGALLLMDGIQCGFFRCGAFQSYQRITGESPVEPDAVAMAKGIGGGFPLGAVWMTCQAAALFDRGSHGSTFGGNPAACRTGLAVLHYLQALGIENRVRSLEGRFRSGLKRLEDRRKILTFRGLGLMWGFEPAVEPGPARKYLQQAGLLVMPAAGRNLRLLPPLTVTEDEADEAFSAMEETL